MNIKPVGGKILVKPTDSKTHTESGLFIPEGSREKSREGEVVALGAGARTEKGQLIPFNVKIGDKVLFSGGDNIKIEGKTFKLVFEDEILAVIE